MNNTWSDPVLRRFEDFQVDDRCFTRGRTVDGGDISRFAGLTGDFYPLHIDEEYANSTRFGTRVAHGPLTFSIAVGLVGLTGWYGDAVIGFLGVDNMRAVAPVKSGDTLRVVATVIEAALNRSGRTGAVTSRYSVINQYNDEVFTFEQKNLMQTRAGDNG